MKSLFLILFTFCTLLSAEEGAQKAAKKILELNNLMNSHDDFSVKCTMLSTMEYDQESLKKKYKELYHVMALSMQNSSDRFLMTAYVKDRKKFAITSKHLNKPKLALKVKRNAPKDELPIKFQERDKSTRAFSDGVNIYSEHLSGEQVFHATFEKNKDIFKNEKLYGLMVSFPFITEPMFVKDKLKEELSDPNNKFSMNGEEIIIKRKGLIKRISFCEKGYVKKLIYDMTEMSNSLYNSDPLTGKVDKNFKPVLNATITFEFSEWKHEVKDDDLKVEITKDKPLQNMDKYLNAKPAPATGPKIYGGRSAAGRAKKK